MKTELIIIGAGGAGYEALWVCQRMASVNPDKAPRVIGFADDDPAIAGTDLGGYRVLGKIAEVMERYRGSEMLFHCAIGNNRTRQHVVATFEQAGLSPATLVDPTVVVAETATIGEGCYVGPQSNISPYARIGRHVLINTQVSAGHHCVVEDFAQLCPGSRISGHCKLGPGAFVASNAVVAPGKKIGAWATLGAASFAMKDVPDASTAIGNPARIVLK